MGQRFKFNFILFSIQKTAVMKFSSISRKGAVLSTSITLLMKLFLNCLESKDRASVGKIVNGSMKAT
jgi:hypothetical protein